MELLLRKDEVSSIHIPNFHILAFDKNNTQGFKLTATNNIRMTEDDKNVSILSDFEYDSITHSRTSLFDVEEFKEALYDCITSETPRDIFHHSLVSRTIESVKTSFVSDLHRDNPNALFFSSPSSKRFTGGLGLVRNGERVVALFESFTIEVVKEHADMIFNELFIISEDEFKYNNEPLVCEYFDLNYDRKIIFEAEYDDDYDFDTFIFKDIVALDKEDEFAKRVTKVIEIPYVEKSSGDMIGDQAYQEYRDSRMSIISEIKTANRKKAITNKFSNIDLL